jgi:hypothetical protein
VSFLHRRPEPEHSPCQLVLEELRDLWAVAELLSLRLAAIEARQPADRPQGLPEPPPSR